MANKVKDRLLKFNTPRRIVQFLSFIFFSAIIFNLGVLPLMVPVLWTWGLPQNTVGDSFTAIQLMLGGGNTNVVFPWLAVASFLIVGIFIGKSLCGWVCPFGFVQDLIGYVRRKQTDLSPRTHETMLYVKYAILALVLLISVTFAASKLLGVSGTYEGALGIFAYAPFTAISPSETLFATLPRMVLNFRNALVQNQAVDILSGIGSLPPLFWAQIVIMGAVLVFAAYVPRSWCRYLCPHGAIMGVMNRFSFIGLKREPFKCTRGECRVCVEVCPTRVKILDLPWEKFSDPDCIYCLKCVDACENKAIKLKYP
ncbi:MAG TPA: 4Fe-4S binding protein [Candidatus Bathyarchaeia archaeon]